jgi:hypothetical protein
MGVAGPRRVGRTAPLISGEKGMLENLLTNWKRSHEANLRDHRRRRENVSSVKNSSEKQWAGQQGCQMAYFQIKNLNLGKFCRVLELKLLGYITAILYILMATLHSGSLVHFPRFGVLCQEKSGKPAWQALRYVPEAQLKALTPWKVTARHILELTRGRCYDHNFLRIFDYFRPKNWSFSKKQ